MSTHSSTKSVGKWEVIFLSVFHTPLIVVLLMLAKARGWTLDTKKSFLEYNLLQETFQRNGISYYRYGDITWIIPSKPPL